MEPISLTEDEIKLAFEIDDEDESWGTFRRFLTTQIVLIENSANIPTPMEDPLEAWYLDFIRRSAAAYVSLVPFPDRNLPWWIDSALCITNSSRKFVLFLAQIIAKKQVAIAVVAGKNSSDVDPPEHNSSLVPVLGSSPQEKTPASSTRTKKPRPPICFATQQLYPRLSKPSDTIYLYYSSPLSLSSVLQDLRKKHELGSSSRFALLRVKTPSARIRVLVGEEQEDWDWEEVMENISRHGHKANIFFEVQPE